MTLGDRAMGVGYRVAHSALVANKAPLLDGAHTFVISFLTTVCKALADEVPGQSIAERMARGAEQAFIAALPAKLIPIVNGYIDQGHGLAVTFFDTQAKARDS